MVSRMGHQVPRGARAREEAQEARGTARPGTRGRRRQRPGREEGRAQVQTGLEGRALPRPSPRRRARSQTADEWRRRTRPAAGHAPRTGDNDHQRGSKRGDRSSSSSSDDPDPDPEPRRSECGCGASIDHLRADARYLDDHRVREWHRRQAELELIRDPAQVDPDVVRTAPCSCADCRHARNGGDAVDLEVLAVWIEQIGDHHLQSRSKPERPPRLTNGAEPIVVIDADGTRTEISPQRWQRSVRHLLRPELGATAPGPNNDAGGGGSRRPAEGRTE